MVHDRLKEKTQKFGTEGKSIHLIMFPDKDNMISFLLCLSDFHFLFVLRSFSNLHISQDTLMSKERRFELHFSTSVRGFKK